MKRGMKGRGSVAKSFEERGPVVAATHEHAALDAVRTSLEQAACRDHPPTLIGPTGDRIELPESVLRVLRQAVRALASDQAVSVVPIEKRLTTQHAANLLNVSRPYLIRLLDEGQIPYTMNGTHRRLLLDDVLRYKKERDERRHEALRELNQISQEMGLYH